MKFSVLMSIYNKENPTYFKECLESIFQQTLKADEIVLVKDGEISPALEYIIETYNDRLPLKIIGLPQNIGLGPALNIGIEHCTHELILRMDTDDFSLPERFFHQVKFMTENPDISVSSAWIEEKDELLEETLFLKKLPISHSDLKEFSKKRSPINHPVAALRKSDVLASGGYPPIFPEDFALWSKMFVDGRRFANIPEVLLYMRTGKNFLKRRGWNFFKGEIGLLKFQYEIGFITFSQYLSNLLVRFSLRIAPDRIKSFLYRNYR